MRKIIEKCNFYSQKFICVNNMILYKILNLFLRMQEVLQK